MSQIPANKLSFQEFIQQYSSDVNNKTLTDREILQIELKKTHDNACEYLVKRFDEEIERLQLDYFIDRGIIINTATEEGKVLDRNPDIGLGITSVWAYNFHEYGALIGPILLAVEVVSTDWEDDYIDKLNEYERLGVNEYWIVDYLAIASRAYLGNPKVPTVFVYHLIDGKYRMQKFSGQERITSIILPKLEITLEEILLSD